ncbi:MAG: hypothetical protein SFW62_06460 [Alphaproteobacteria bacterium]|nr:hypothetical protein [Alphaproteobacteria bacterium]
MKLSFRSVSQALVARIEKYQGEIFTVGALTTGLGIFGGWIYTAVKLGEASGGIAAVGVMMAPFVGISAAAMRHISQDIRTEEQLAKSEDALVSGMVRYSIATTAAVVALGFAAPAFSFTKPIVEPVAVREAAPIPCRLETFRVPSGQIIRFDCK